LSTATIRTSFGIGSNRVAILLSRVKKGTQNEGGGGRRHRRPSPHERHSPADPNRFGVFVEGRLWDGSAQE
jgi:hypothetical protein